MSFSFGGLRRWRLRLVSLSALGVLAFVLLEPVLAGAAEQSNAPAQPLAAAPPAQHPAAAETPQPPSSPGAAVPAAPAPPAAPTATPEAMPGVETKPPVTIYYLGKHYDEPLPLSYAEKP